MLPEGYGTSHQENPYFSREMPKPPEPRHHTATHYGAVPGFISSGHASDAGSHRASDAGSGNEGKMPFGRGGAYRDRRRFGFFGRGPRPEAAARRRPP